MRSLPSLDLSRPLFHAGMLLVPHGPVAGNLRDRTHFFVCMEAPGEARLAGGWEAVCTEA